jgi:hypothetical protein
VDSTADAGAHVQVAGWHPDPVGRHDFRFWSGSAWTKHVSDQGLQTEDPIDPITPQPVTIRPSASAVWSQLQSVPLWRWGLSIALLAVVVVVMLGAGQGLLLELIGSVALVWILVLPILYFKLFYIRADMTGIEVRNQLGVRRLIPRERIASISIGKAWDGALSTADFAYIVSPAGGRLGRFILQSWKPDDFRLVANALGLQLYGRPNRHLDEFHSAKPVEYAVRYYGASAIVGILVGCALTILLIAGVAVALLLARVGTH